MQKEKIFDYLSRIRNNKLFDKVIISIIILIIILIASFFMLRYYVEGETNLPFTLSKIIIISSAEGRNLTPVDTKWSFNLQQNNDIYIDIDKNEENEKNETIKAIRIENIQIDKKQSIGNIKNYRPSQAGLFETNDEYIITEKLEYEGSNSTSINELKIGNQGGTIIFRSSNTDIITYNSNEDQVVHNGIILAKAGITKEQLQYSIKFDLIIETGRGIKYKGTVNLELPQGEILTEGRGTVEKTDFDDVIFKRI